MGGAYVARSTYEGRCYSWNSEWVLDQTSYQKIFWDRLIAILGRKIEGTNFWGRVERMFGTWSQWMFWISRKSRGETKHVQWVKILKDSRCYEGSHKFEWINFQIGFKGYCKKDGKY